MMVFIGKRRCNTGAVLKISSPTTDFSHENLIPRSSAARWFILFLAMLCSACSLSDDEPPDPPYLVSSLEELDTLMSGLPENTADAPWNVVLRGVNLRNLGGSEDGLEPLFRTFHGKYLSLNMDACTGATIGWGSAVNQNTQRRPNRDKLVSVILPAPAVRVGYRNFQGSSALKSVKLHPGLQTIGIAAFQGCASLERVELPATLVHIEDQVFEGCGSLKTVVVRAAVPPGLGLGRYSPPLPVGEDPGVFTGVHPDFQILVPAGKKAVYQAASGWSFYRDRIRDG